jgi:hypothetical protein
MADHRGWKEQAQVTYQNLENVISAKEKKVTLIIVPTTSPTIN